MFDVNSADVHARSGKRGRHQWKWCLQQEAGPKTTVEQALMRGLDTA
jgi:hypothetical protein